MKTLSKSLLLAVSTLLFHACSSSDAPQPQEINGQPFHIAFAEDPEGSSKTYVQGFDDIMSIPQISFEGAGFPIPSTRTARFYAVNDGKNIVNLDYGGGTVQLFEYKGGAQYAELKRIDISEVMGTKNPRFSKVNKDYGMLHATGTVEHVTENGKYVKSRMKSTFGIVKFDGLVLEKSIVHNIELDEADKGLYISRYDAPVVVGNKVFYGFAVSKYDPNTAANTTYTYDKVRTLVMDFPSLANPKVISTNVNGAKGSTNGYRTPTQHVDEKGDIYQIVTVGTKDHHTFILRIKNGEYDNSYSFDFTQKIGTNTKADGWFYIENGIGYVPYLDSDKGTQAEADGAYSLARIDLYNQKVTKYTGLPEKLWFRQYQWSVARNGKFYMALSPNSGEGNIYAFDYKSESPTAYEKGAKIVGKANTAWIGIF